MLTFTNAQGQSFSIDGINDQLAYEDAIKHLNENRPFGRQNMKRLEHFYGVKVSFVPRQINNHEDDGY